MPPPYFWILSLTTSVHFLVAETPEGDLVVPTRQTSSSGKPKSPRIQVVLPEDLCERLTALAEQESRTVSNMARVLIQQGLDRLDAAVSSGPSVPQESMRQQLERQQQQPGRLRGRPRRIRLKG